MPPGLTGWPMKAERARVPAWPPIITRRRRLRIQSAREVRWGMKSPSRHGTGLGRAVVAVAMLAAAGVTVGCTPPIEPGVWTIQGHDSRLGQYDGVLEIRNGGGSEPQAIRVVRYHTATHTDGRGIDTVWTGSVDSGDRTTFAVNFALDRADFISRVGNLRRTDRDRTPLAVKARVLQGDRRRLELEYCAREDPDLRIVELGVSSGVGGDQPIWRSARVVRPTVVRDAQFLITRLALHGLFQRYHRLPEVRRFAGTPAFEHAVPLLAVERTDFEFYRAHPDRVRVVNKVVDAISLAETEVRANAFRSSFSAKEAHFQRIMDSGGVGPHGLVLASVAASGAERPDEDSLLWTGVYSYTQALRYRHTGKPEALDNLRRSLRGVFTAMDITGNSRTFARAVRVTGPALTGGWRRGSGEWSNLDWLAGGNNDMSKGLMLAIIAGSECLPAEDPLRAEVAEHAMAMLELCEFLEAPHDGCGIDGHRRVIPSVNPGIAKLLAGITCHDRALVEDGLSWLRQPLLTAYAHRGGGPFFIDGLSDWSGNHLTLTKTLSLLWALSRSGDADLEARWIRASGQAWRVLRSLDSSLHAAVALTSGALVDPDERCEAVDQALWGLRSYPIPKHQYPVDHRIRSDFVMSPFPALPWKGDWLDNPDRQQSIVGHGLLESAVDGYWWNDNPFSLGGAGNADDVVPGVDYLLLYWIARDGGLIAELD